MLGRVASLSILTVGLLSRFALVEPPTIDLNMAENLRLLIRPTSRQRLGGAVFVHEQKRGVLLLRSHA